MRDERERAEECAPMRRPLFGEPMPWWLAPLIVLAISLTIAVTLFGRL
jgi:hypothetical protein